MTVRRLQDDGDISTSGRQFLFDLDDCMQTLQTRMRLFYGEYFRDINEGTNWFGTVLLKGVPDSVKDAEIRRRIQDYDKIKGINSYSSTFDINTRSVTVNVSVLTDFGTADLTVEDVI